MGLLVVKERLRDIVSHLRNNCRQIVMQQLFAVLILIMRFKENSLPDS